MGQHTESQGTAPKGAGGGVHARASLIARLPYLDYNYGRDHVLTRSAEAGDLDGFIAASRHVTQNMDIVVTDLCDLAVAALAKAGGES